MQSIFKIDFKFSKVVPALIAPLILAACGGSGGSGNEVTPQVPAAPQNTVFSLSVSDAPIDNAISVNVFFDEVTLIGDSVGNVVFPVTDENGAPLMIDLLTVQGADFETIVDNVEIESGTYNQIRLSVTDDSFIEMVDGSFPLRVPSGELKLDGFTAQPGFESAFTIEFDLRKSLVDPVGQDVILLKPRGVRLVANDDVGVLEGTVAESLILAPECAVKVDAQQGNALYIYEGHSLNVSMLGDDADEFEGDTEIRPLTVVPVTFNEMNQVYGFEAGFLPAGNYTVAFSCLALFDQPESDENEEDGFALQTNDEVVISANSVSVLTIE